MYNKRLENIEISKIAAITNKVIDGKTIRLEVGDVNIIPSDEVLVHLKNCATSEGLHYSKSQGNQSLIKKIFNKEKKNYQDLTEVDIYITAGGSIGIFLALQSLLNPDDKVLVFNPTWSHFKDMISILGGKVVFAELEEKNNYHFDESLFQNIDVSNLKAVILANPNNPTGTVFSQQELNILHTWCKRNNIFIIYDQEYEIYSLSQPCGFSSLENIVVSKSYSKSLGLSGMRLGYIFGDKKWVEKIKICGLYSMMFANSFAQQLISDSFDILDCEFERNKKIIFERAEIVIQNLELTTNKYEGGVYVWAKIPVNDILFCESLLKNKQVSVVPGSVFGGKFKNYIRISLGETMENLREAVDRINIHIKEGNYE